MFLPEWFPFVLTEALTCNTPVVFIYCTERQDDDSNDDDHDEEG